MREVRIFPWSWMKKIDVYSGEVLSSTPEIITYEKISEEVMITFPSGARKAGNRSAGGGVYGAFMEREEDLKRRTMLGIAFDLDPASVPLHDFLANGQAETGARLT